MNLLERRTRNDHNVRHRNYPVSAHIPNAETVAAMAEAEHGADAGSLDVTSFAAFMKSVNAID